MDDDQLGFFHYWIEEFAKNWDGVSVICLERGAVNLPADVRVFSLGKERYGSNRFKKLIYLFNFYRLIWKLRNEYDAVFVHMNQIYALLGWPVWRFGRKKIGIWYAHGSTPLSLRLAAKLADHIFTSTEDGCGLESGKKRIVGQGIDTGFFRRKDGYRKHEPFKIMTYGRISPVKNHEVLIKAAAELIGRGERIAVEDVGGIGTPEQQKYLDGLQDLVREKKLREVFRFPGPAAYRDLAGYLEEADLFVNMSGTGSLDKAVLEAMSFGLPVMTCNRAFADLLGGYGGKLMYAPGNSAELAEKAERMIHAEGEVLGRLGEELREKVVAEHSLKSLITKISRFYGD